MNEALLMKWCYEIKLHSQTKKVKAAMRRLEAARAYSPHLARFPHAQINQHFNDFAFVAAVQLKAVEPIELIRK